MHDNSRKSLSIDFNSSLNADRFSVDHPDSSRHMSVLKFSDASDSDSSGEAGEEGKDVSHVCAMRDLRKPKTLTKKKRGRMGNALLMVSGKKFVLVPKLMFALI